MHPALSVIVFTSASGAGYGLLAWLGLLVLTGALPREGALGSVALFLALAAVTAGLLSSTLHLGRPERAWRAFSQWRTSWLSREGVMAVLTYVPAGLLWLFWTFGGRSSPLLALLGLLTGLGALGTIAVTAMIYASLKPVRQWNSGLTVQNYLALGIYSGGLALVFLFHAFGYQPVGLTVASVAAGLAALALKLLYWRFIDSTPSASTIGSATGLGGLGRVTQFEAPHTEENYLLKEMGFRIARKHAARLRVVALLLAFALPLVALHLALLLPPVAAALVTCVGLVSALAGILTERWLFFAEAKHTVTLYYGAQTA